MCPENIEYGAMPYFLSKADTLLCILNYLQMRPCWILNLVMRRKHLFLSNVFAQTANTWSVWFIAQSRESSDYEKRLFFLHSALIYTFT